MIKDDDDDDNDDKAGKIEEVESIVPPTAPCNDNEGMASDDSDYEYYHDALRINSRTTVRSRIPTYSLCVESIGLVEGYPAKSG